MGTGDPPPAAAPQMPAPAPAAGAGGGEEAAAGGGSDTDGQLQKKKRGLLKKLKQIDELEAKRDAGAWRRARFLPPASLAAQGAARWCCSLVRSPWWAPKAGQLSPRPSQST